MTFPGNQIAPGLSEFERMARDAFQALPDLFRERASHVSIRIQDFADADLLKEMEIDDPFSLSGLYAGVPLTEESVSHPSLHPPEVYLFRRPILDEWAARGDVALDHLIAHVLIHELGHHFGWSDEAMHKALDEAD